MPVREAIDLRRPDNLDRWRRIATLVAIGVLIAAMGVAVLVAFIISWLQCDDACDQIGDDDPDPTWSQQADAFEWQLQLWLTLGGLALSIAAFAFACLRRERSAWAAAFGAVLLGVGWMIFLGHNDVGGF